MLNVFVGIFTLIDLHSDVRVMVSINKEISERYHFAF